MAALFGVMPREKSTLAWSYYRYRIQCINVSDGVFIEIFFFILFYHVIQKNKLITLLLRACERYSFCADLLCGPCICSFFGLFARQIISLGPTPEN